ncbi:hypothetical protein [Flagellimonas sp. 2504JD4-2]
MNYNILTYVIYLPIIVFIMIKVGWLFFKNGEVFLFHLFHTDIPLAKSINKLLLIGYYFTNIGYAIITIAYWKNIGSVLGMLNSLSLTLGKIILLLSLLHYNNIFWLKYIHKSKLLNQ